MNQPFIAIILILIAAAQFSEVKAQSPITGTGDLGSTTTGGNTFWVTAQVALQRGESEAAFTSSDRACQEGTAIACSVAGEMIVQGQTRMGTPEQSVALFQKGCDLGNANACQGLGLMLVQGIGITADAQKGRSVMQKACQASNAMACVNLGLMFKMGLFGSPNHREADLYFKRALTLQPDNKMALQALAENSQAAQGKPSVSGPPKPATPMKQTTELRGRLTTPPASTPIPATAPQMVATTCWDSVSTLWNAARDARPSKPTWNTAASAQTLRLSEAQTIGLLMLAASKSATGASSGPQTLAACQRDVEPELKQLLSQPWTIAPNSSAENTLIQMNPPINLADRLASTDQTLLLIIDAGGSTPRRHPQADKAFALVRVSCDGGGATPLFFFQTDRQGKVRPALTGSNAALPTAVTDRARRLGCAPQSERRLWTQLSGLEAALSLRFEQDQQQTP
ncbi:MAG: tetratricopeptide repeat protein [Hyphomonadaceae bacterium]